MGSNKFILAAVAGIAGIAILNAWVAKKGITRILAGAYVLLLLLSLLDLFGGVWSQLAGGLAMLALLSMLLTQTPWDALSKVTGSQTITGQQLPKLPSATPPK